MKTWGSSEVIVKSILKYQKLIASIFFIFKGRNENVDKVEHFNNKEWFYFSNDIFIFLYVSSMTCCCSKTKKPIGALTTNIRVIRNMVNIIVFKF